MELKNYKRISRRKNIINIKNQLRWLGFMLFFSVIAAHLVAYTFLKIVL
jgi:hypothetical protein